MREGFGFGFSFSGPAHDSTFPYPALCPHADRFKTLPPSNPPPSLPWSPAEVQRGQIADLRGLIWFLMVNGGSTMACISVGTRKGYT